MSPSPRPAGAAGYRACGSCNRCAEEWSDPVCAERAQSMDELCRSAFGRTQGSAQTGVEDQQSPQSSTVVAQPGLMLIDQFAQVIGPEYSAIEQGRAQCNIAQSLPQ